MKKYFPGVRISFISTLIFSCISYALQARTIGVSSGEIQRQMLTRIPASLNRIYADFVNGRGPGVRPLAFRNTEGPYHIGGGYVGIEASADDPVALKSTLERLGLRGGVRLGNLVSGQFPIGRLPQLGGIDMIHVLRPTLRSSHFQDPDAAVNSLAVPENPADPVDVEKVGDQGDLAMGTNRLRDHFGVDGSGITVGVVSDSYNQCGGAEQDIAQGRLPQAGVAVLHEGTKSCHPQPHNEGRAMLQVIHKVAPGAALAFTSEGPEDVESGAWGLPVTVKRILELAGCPDTIPKGQFSDCQPTSGVKADVIVDDVANRYEPFYMDGLWSQAITWIEQAGISYITAAGNDGHQSYESTFRGSGVEGYAGGELHDFDPGPEVDTHQLVYIKKEWEVPFLFQWDSPYHSQCTPKYKEFCPGATSQYNLYLTGSGAGEGIILARAEDVALGKDPINNLIWKNEGIDVDGIPGEDTEFNLVIEKVHGIRNNRLKYIIDVNGADPQIVKEYYAGGSTVYGHSNSFNGLSVGAAVWWNTPYYGSYPAEPVSYSGLGGTHFYYNAAGEAIKPLPQQNPGLLGPNNVWTYTANDPQFQKQFGGTSAAAPEVAGAVALIKSYQPDLPPGAIRQALEATAMPWYTDNRFGYAPSYEKKEKFDFLSGYGFTDAFSAANHLFVGANQIIPDLVGNGQRDRLFADNRVVEIMARFTVGSNLVNSHVDRFFAFQADGQWYSLKSVGKEPLYKATWVPSGPSPLGITAYEEEQGDGLLLDTKEYVWPVLSLQQTKTASYTFYVGVDTLPNGKLDPDYLTYTRLTVEMGNPRVHLLE